MEQNEEVTTEDSVEVTETDSEVEENYEPTLEDYQKERERRLKAEKKLVELKKAQKSQGSKETEEIVEKRIRETEFYRENPEFKEYKEEISKYASKGLDIEEAAALIRGKDPSFGNKKKANEMAVTDEAGAPTKKSYTAQDLVKMSQADYNRVKALESQGKVTIRRS